MPVAVRRPARVAVTDTARGLVPLTPLERSALWRRAFRNGGGSIFVRYLIGSGPGGAEAKAADSTRPASLYVAIPSSGASACMSSAISAIRST
jgi:hypothetical protein